jgi:hypothetical protein
MVEPAVNDLLCLVCSTPLDGGVLSSMLDVLNYSIGYDTRT